MDEYEYAIKVPKDRIAVIIGEKGEKKRELEEVLGVDVQIDSEEGDVTLSGTDAIALFTAREVIKAIARGFNPDLAKQLLKTDNVLEVISLPDYGNSKNHMIRLKGRVIGEGGRSRSTIEELARNHFKRVLPPIAKLTPEQARRNSPVLTVPARSGPLLLPVGALEGPEYLRQTNDLAAAWRGRGRTCAVMEMPGLHHFSIICQLEDPGSDLSLAILRQMGSA